MNTREKVSGNFRVQSTDFNCSRYLDRDAPIGQTMNNFLSDQEDFKSTFKRKFSFGGLVVGNWTGRVVGLDV